MGYLITAGHPPVHGESITDGQWLDILKHARDAGFSRPPLTLARGEAKDIPEDEARGLYDHLWVALGTSLKDSPVTEVEGANLDVLDRETVLHVSDVLRYLAIGRCGWFARRRGNLATNPLISGASGLSLQTNVCSGRTVPV